MIMFSKPDCIRTYSGREVNIFKPKREMFCIEDISWALSKEQRFSNMLSKNYSVGQHCLIGTELIPKEYKLTFLLHESTEPYMRDFASPIKNHAAFSEYRRIENDLMGFLAEIFGFQYPLPDRVKEMDEFMFKREWNALMLKNEPFSHVILTQAEVNRRFLKTYKELTKK